MRGRDLVMSSEGQGEASQKKCTRWHRQTSGHGDSMTNLFKFVYVLLSALVERVGVSRMRDFYNTFSCDSIQSRTNSTVAYLGSQFCFVLLL